MGRMEGAVVEAEDFEGRPGAEAPSFFAGVFRGLKPAATPAVVEAEGSNRRSFDFGLRPSLRMTDSEGASGFVASAASRPKRRKYM
jgi:hypothetical protein